MRAYLFGQSWDFHKENPGKASIQWDDISRKGQSLSYIKVGQGACFITNWSCNRKGPAKISQAGHQLFATAAPRSDEVAKWLRRPAKTSESHEMNRRSKPPWQQDETSPSWGYLQMLNLVAAVELHLQNRTCQPSPPAPSCGPSSRDGSWKLKARSLPSHHKKWTYSSLKNEHRALVKRHLRKSQNLGAHLVRACAVEMQMKKGTLMREFAAKMPGARKRILIEPRA